MVASALKEPFKVSGARNCCFITPKNKNMIVRGNDCHIVMKGTLNLFLETAGSR
jgi:hypothetical protein